MQELNSWIESQPGWQSAGYIAAIDNAAAGSLTLLWSGSSPMQELAIAKAQSLGLSATIQQRPLKLPQIQAIEQKLMANKAEFAAAGFALSTVTGVQASTSAIQINGEVTAADAGTAQLKATTASIASLAGAITGVQIAVNPNSVSVSAVGKATQKSTGLKLDDDTVPSRQSDEDPHSAGAYMASGTDTCSSGFTLAIGDYAYTTTARHCVPDESGWDTRSGDGDSFGTISEDSSDGGLAVLSAEGQAWAYDGSWDNDEGYAKEVVNSYDPGLDDLVCTGGGNSGEHCDVEVEAEDVLFSDGCGDDFYTDEALQIDSGAIAVIQGDSGGPVISLNGLSGDDGEVDAVGMIQGLDENYWYSTGTDCGDVRDNENLCGVAVLFSSINLVLEDGGLDATLDTY